MTQSMGFIFNFICKLTVRVHNYFSVIPGECSDRIAAILHHEDYNHNEYNSNYSMSPYSTTGRKSMVLNSLFLMADHI